MPPKRANVAGTQSSHAQDDASGSAKPKSSPYRGVTLFRPTGKWRAQISASGKTTSLGDHDTEEQAAIAFDRAAISKDGEKARTNFPQKNYANEIEDLQSMDMESLVTMLRFKARKKDSQSSQFRGVSLLKQTGGWHAQINIGRKQEHLGFFPTDECAARAYDRAAINKGAKEATSKIVTNFDIRDYSQELDLLRNISQVDLVAALATESTRRNQKLSGMVFPETVAGRGMIRPASEQDRAANEALIQKAVRAQPKSTLKNPLFTTFGKPKDPESSERDEPRASAAGPRASKSRARGRNEEAQANAEQLEYLLAGAPLPSLENGPAIPLPLVHPITGAPAKILGQGGDVDRTAEAATPYLPTRSRVPPSRQAIGPTTPSRPPKRPFQPSEQHSPAPAGLRSPAGRRKIQEATGTPTRPVRSSNLFPGTPTPKARRTTTFRHNSPGNPASPGEGSSHGRQPRHQEYDDVFLLDLPRFSARPRTKRQEALEDRKRDEAAATLASHCRPFPHPAPEEVEVTLMDIAEAAELAELQDREEQHRLQQSEASNSAAPAGQTAPTTLPLHPHW